MSTKTIQNKLHSNYGTAFEIQPSRFGGYQIVKHLKNGISIESLEKTPTEAYNSFKRSFTA